MINKEIKKELNYCLQCKNPQCEKGCPLNNSIRDAIKLVKEERYKEAYELFCNTTVLQSICGRVCPFENQCQGKCIRGIKGRPVQIGKIEAFLGDLALANDWKIPKSENDLKNKKIAVVGSGPSSLTCSAFLARRGAEVTIYEKKNRLGGLMAFGIPEFRLEKDVLEKTINKILDLGINYKLNIEVGKDILISELEEKYDYIYLGIGANISNDLNVEGEDLHGVIGGNELLEYKDFPNFKNKVVAIIGGGNVAIDCARTIKRLGAKNVTIIYRRAEEQMAAAKIEIELAKNDGVEFLFQNNIIRIIGKENVEKIECIKTELIRKNNEKKLTPINIENSNYYMNVDYVIKAIGSHSDKQLVTNIGVNELNGIIQVDKNNLTSNKKIYAGGDIVGEIKTVAFAARSGRNIL